VNIPKMIILLPLLSFLTTWLLCNFIKRKFGKRASVAATILVFVTLAVIANKFLNFQSDGTFATQANNLTSVLVIVSIALSAVVGTFFNRQL
jgi:formate hydrogenlyase subunit 3/multisubunit Na+/H+ antiporter MnhD subunit